MTASQHTPPPGNDDSHVWAGASPTGIGAPPAGERSVGEAAYVESGFNPFAVSSAGAQGVAQFMPGTARGYHLADPFDATAAIDAQAHLMRDLLRRFSAVALALAAYNAGPAPVAACGCVPAIPETRGYVARILGLMGGAGESVGPGGGLVVRLIE